MAVLSKKWGTAERVSPVTTDVTTGEAAEDAEAKEKVLADSPFFIYVTDGSESKEFDKVDKVILDNNEVLVGMWAFKCVKMTPEAVDNDPLLSGEGKKVPRFLFVTPDYEKVTVVEGAKMSSSNVITAMAKVAKKAYKIDLKKQIKGTMKLLNEFNKINNAKKTLIATRDRLGADIPKAKAKKIKSELAELEEDQKKADEKKAELLTFKLKAKKA